MRPPFSAFAREPPARRQPGDADADRRRGRADVVPLLLIFFYLLQAGITALNLDFFTRIPAPVGAKRAAGWGTGSSAPCCSSARGAARAAGRHRRGSSWPRRGQPLGNAGALRRRRDERHPLHRHRDLRLGVGGAQHGQLLRARRRRRARHHAAPDGDAHHRGDGPAGPAGAARGRAGARLHPLAHHAGDRAPRRRAAAS
jgi:hypothetical protein